MRARLRPALSREELALLCPVPHDHTGWDDHVLRVAATIELAGELITRTGPPGTIADLSCGDAAIARTLAGQEIAAGRAARVILGDFAPGYEFTGPIEQTLNGVTRAGLFICTETIEHLDDPDTVLAMIRARADALVLSTPLGEDVRSPVNVQHYWGWDHDGVREMLTGTGWQPVLQGDITWTDEHGHPWKYQIWGCT